MRPYQVATAAAIALIAAVAMFDSRGVFSVAPGDSPGDVGASWYPFWAAAVMGVGAIGVGYRALVTPQSAEGVFAGRESVLAVVRLVVAMVAYAGSFAWLGFYLSTGLYMGFFAAYFGRYRWYRSLASAVITPLVIYLMFEVGFKLFLPKSVFYPYGFPF